MRSNAGWCGTLRQINIDRLQRFVVKRYKTGIAGQEVCGTEGKEAFVVIVVVGAYCSLTVVYLPVLTVGALPYCGCVAVVQDPYIKVRDAVNRTYGTGDRGFANPDYNALASSLSSIIIEE